MSQVHSDNTVCGLGIVLQALLMGIICGHNDTKLLQHGLLCTTVSARCDSGVLFFP